jgi:DNA polymerase
MGALDMGLAEEELPLLVNAWRQSNPHIVKFGGMWTRPLWKQFAINTPTRQRYLFTCHSGMLFITLPSGRRLAM